MRADGTLGPYPVNAACDATGFAPNTEELGVALRRAADEVPGRRFVVAAHGVTTTSDAWREELVGEAVAELRRAVADGVPVDGYFHDTGSDGYEGRYGFEQHRGLVARDRTPKGSGRALRAVLLGDEETDASASAISSNVPPTCTVDASWHAGSFQGIGPSSAQSSLKAAGPHRKRRSRAR